MITVVTAGSLARHVHLVNDMFRLRRRIFADALDWDVTTVGDMEIDRFDAISPVYLIAQNDDGKVCGCARLLPSTGPTMLEDVFPILIGAGTYQKSETIWESSRFAVDTQLGGREASRLISPYTFELFAGMLEFGLSCGWTQVVTVTDLRLERVLGIARWPLLRIGDEHKIGATVAVAGLVEISERALECVRRAGRISASVIRNFSELRTVDAYRSEPVEMPRLMAAG